MAWHNIIFGRTYWDRAVATTSYKLEFFSFFLFEVYERIVSTQTIFASNKINSLRPLLVVHFDNLLRWNSRRNFENTFSNFEILSVNQFCDFLFSFPIKTANSVWFPQIVWNLGRSWISIGHYVYDASYKSLILFIDLDCLLLHLLFGMILQLTFPLFVLWGRALVNQRPSFLQITIKTIKVFVQKIASSVSRL